METALTIALPKGRIFDSIQKHFADAGINISFDGRQLRVKDDAGKLEAFLVKNSDLPTYVHHGVAGLGFCGEDVLYESGFDFVRLLEAPYGSTRMCLAAPADTPNPLEAEQRLTVATKFTRFTRDYFHAQGRAVDIIRLAGSVELAPLLGLSSCIVDLVETGSTLAANNLRIVEELDTIRVFLIANPAYYKLYFREIRDLVDRLENGGPDMPHGTGRDSDE